MSALPSNPAEVSDAAILQKIFLGSISKETVVSEGSNLRGVPASEAPRYTTLITIAERVAAVELLNEPSLLSGAKPDFTESYTETQLAPILLKLFQEHKTGFLRLTTGEKTRTIAISHGLPIVIHSASDAEQFGAYLLAKEIVTPKNACQAVKNSSDAPQWLGLTLLEEKILSTEVLLESMKDYQQLCLLHMFALPETEAAFFSDPRAASLCPTLGLTMATILRSGIWRLEEADLRMLKEMTAHLTAKGNEITVALQTGQFEWELNSVERMVLRNISSGETIDLLLSQTTERRQKGLILKATYVLVEMGLLSSTESRKSDDLTMEQRKSYFERKKLKAEAKGLLIAGNAPLAQRILRKLHNQYADDAEIMAYLAMCMFKTSPKRNGQRAYVLATKALAMSDSDNVAYVHAGLSVIHAGLESEEQATGHRKKAIDGSQKNQEMQQDILALIQLSGHRIGLEEEKGLGSIYPGLMAAVVAVVLLFVLSNIVPYGTKEYQHSPDDVFFFARRLTLMAAALFGLSVYERTDPIKVVMNLGWSFPYRYALYALIYGVILGYFSPLQQLTGTMIAVLQMGLLHVVADELFFRGMLTRFFLDAFDSRLTAIALSALIFGAYQITYGSMWFNLNLYMKFYWIGLIAVAAGLPFAWIYSRTRSIAPGLICYGIAHLLILYISKSSDY